MTRWWHGLLVVFGGRGSIEVPQSRDFDGTVVARWWHDSMGRWWRGGVRGDGER
ncbi:MAG: hypothetical protein KF678_13335 [Phycisphaeraceae bacterium]|nr:hypothetical protein [Phycisphaeraceae bacterium]